MQLEPQKTCDAGGHARHHRTDGHGLLLFLFLLRKPRLI